MRNYFIAVLTLFCFVSVFGQKVTYFGEIVDMDSKAMLSDVTVSVLHNGSEVASAQTKKGKYTVKFDVGKVYTIRYSKPGYINKIIKVDVTKVDEETMPIDGKIFPSINIDLFTERSGADFSFLDNEPVVEWTFDNDKMDFNAAKMNSMKVKINDRLEQAAKAGAGNDAPYNALIQEADQFFNKKEYQSALDKYIAATKVPGKQAEKHPNNRIVEIGDILQKQDEENLTFKQNNAEYVKLIEEADKLANQKKYDAAIDKYYDASDLNPDEQYPIDRIAELKKERDNAKKRADYDEHIELADMFLKQNSLEAARDNYEKASKLFPDEKYPKDQLAKLSGELDKQAAAKELKDKYNKAVEDADALYKDEKWEEAIEKYKEALTYESAASYPADRITMAEGKLAEELAEKEKQENFDKLVKQGDDAVGEKAYEQAIQHYANALALIDDNGVKTKKSNAESLLAEQQVNAEQQAKFDNLVAAGDQGIDNKNYQVAVDKYTEALTIMTNAEVQSKLTNAQTLLTQEKENASKLDAFNELVTAGDKLVTSKDYEDAITKYNEALGLIDDEGVKTKRNNAQELWDAKELAEAKEKNFQLLIQEGDAKMELEKYEEALAKFNEALTLKENDKDAKIKRDEAQRQWDKQKENDAALSEFNALVAQADQLVNEGKFEEAIAKYSQALAIKNDQEAKDKKQEAEELLATKNANAAKQEQINNLLASASGKMDAKKYEEAIVDYESVLNLIGGGGIGIGGVNDDYQTAKNGKDEAQRLLAEQLSNSEKEEQFNTLVAQADGLVAGEKFTEAIAKYTEALAIKDDATTQTKKKTAEDLLAAKNDNQAKEEQFNTLVAQADGLVAGEKFTEAIAKYTEALAIKDDATTQTKKKTAEDLLAAKNDNQAKEEQFNTLVAQADGLVASEKFTEAIAKYTEALAIKDDATTQTKKKTAEDLLAAQNAGVEKQEQFNTLVTEADKAFNSENWSDAKTKYIAAKTLVGDDNHVNNRISEIESILDNLAKTANRNEEIQILLDQAANLKPDNKWGQVVQKYEEALLLDNTRADVAALLTDAQTQKATWDAAQSKEQKFANLKQDGDLLMAQQRWEDAKSKYEEALAIQDNSEIRTNLEIIQTKINEAEALAEREVLYKKAMDAGEALAKDKKYEEAIEKFEEAITIKSSDVIASSRIQDMRQLISLRDSANEKDADYTRAMQEGRDALNAKDYSAAIKAFDDALLAKPLDSEATRLKKEAQAEIAKLQALETQFEQLMSAGKTLFDQAIIAGNDIPMLEQAKTKYKEAQTLKPEASQPQTKIVEIDNLLRQIEEDKAGASAATDKKYNDFIELSKVQAGAKKYEEAISSLEKALEIKPSESYPTEKIAEYRAKINELNAANAKEENYNTLISKADLAFDGKEYEKSIGFYEEALAIKAGESYPTNQIAKARKEMEKQAAASIDLSYQNKINTADNFFDAKKYDQALVAYNEALLIKPADKYATDKVAEVTRLIADAKAKETADAAKNAEYQRHITQADELFAKEDYLEAKKYYDKAIGVKPTDVYAIERSSLSVIKSKEKTEDENEELYRKIVVKADEYFDDENWEKAIELYERASTLRSFDPYPPQKINEIHAILNANVKEIVGVDYLGVQSNISILEGAALLLEGERMREDMKRTAVETQLKKNEGIEQDKSLSDWEERHAYNTEVREILDIRDQLAIDETVAHYEFVEEVNKQQVIFEGIEVDKIEKDITSRHTYTNEVEDLYDLQEALYLDVLDEHFEMAEGVHQQQVIYEHIDVEKQAKDASVHQVYQEEVTTIIDINDQLYKEELGRRDEFIKQVDDIQKDYEKLVIQHNNFEAGDVQRVYRDLDYTLDEYDALKLSMEDNHDNIIEHVKVLEVDFDLQSQLEAQHYEAGIFETSNELLKAEKHLENVGEINEIKRHDLEVKIDDIEKGREIRLFDDSNENYERVLQLESDALLAEIRTAEAERDKSIITNILRDEIYALDADIQRKEIQQAQEVYDNNLLVDVQLTAVDIRYNEMQEGMDNNRQVIVEELKVLQRSEELQAQVRDQNQYNVVQNHTDLIERTYDLKDAADNQQKEDLAKLDERVKHIQEVHERNENIRDNNETVERHQTVDYLERMIKEEERQKEEGTGVATNNYEDVKAINAYTDSHAEETATQLKNQSIKTQEMLNKLENNSITFSPLIANTIGEEYPEGVSQENYIRKDKDGIPVQIVTRRFVVKDGHGDVYIRTQTLNGITYSKNGTAITEQSWINGTEDAKLKKNY